MDTTAATATTESSPTPTLLVRRQDWDGSDVAGSINALDSSTGSTMGSTEDVIVINFYEV